MDDDDGVEALTSHVLDECVSLVPEGQVVAISLVRVDGDISFSTVGVDEYDALVGLTGDSSRSDVVEIAEDRFDDGGRTVLAEVRLDGGQGVDEVGVVDAS